MILILADIFDTHADIVEGHLKDAGAALFRLNMDVHSLKNTKLLHSGGNWTIRQNDREFFGKDIQCVWPRRLTMSLTLEQQTDLETRSFRLWRSEWNRCLYGLYASLRDRYWMNPISTSSLADNKYYQFEIARSVGFDIPEIISSNNKSDLIAFAGESPTAIKFMTQDIFKLDDGSFSGIYVNKINTQDLEYFQDYSENPITLQNYIEKDFEVRHTFVDGEHFCCKIESQKSSRAKIDWRRYDVAQTPHSVMSLPSHISEMVERLMTRLSLTYGAFDFIVDKTGDWWYLEVNSAGQWLWIEDLLDLPISESIARTLIKRMRE